MRGEGDEWPFFVSGVARTDDGETTWDSWYLPAFFAERVKVHRTSLGCKILCVYGCS